MSWLTIAWSISAGMSLMLALLHSLLWLKNCRVIVYLLSAIMAFSASVTAIIELKLMHTLSIANFELLLQWSNVSIFFIVIPMVWLVYLQLGRYHRWSVITITAIWSVALVFNFLSEGSLVYEQVNEIRQQTTFWGEQFSVAIGSANPWVLLANIDVVLILIYVTTVSVKSWWRGERQSTLVIGASVVVFIFFGGIEAMLVDNGLITIPYMISFAYLAIVMAMSYELVNQAMQVPKLTRDLEANQKRWINLLSDVQLAVVVINTKGILTYHNPFFQKTTNYTNEELTNRSIRSFIPDNEQQELESLLAKIDQTGPRPHSQWTIVCASGELRRFAWSSVTQLNNEGKYNGFIAVGADITESLSTQKELQNSQKALERFTRISMLGELVSTLAHELNQPLTAILSNAQAALQFMKKEPVDLKEIHDILNDIVRDDKRAANVIHNIRAMLDSGHNGYHWFDSRQVIDEVLSMLKNELSNQSIQLDIDFAENLPQIHANRVEIQQVLMNILLNAKHAMQSITTKLRIIRIQVSQQHSNLLFVISDRGAGIHAEKLSQIFVAFYSTTSSGMGMGLAICKRIINAHGGTINAENLPQGGAQFSFTLQITAKNG